MALSPNTGSATGHSPGNIPPTCPPHPTHTSHSLKHPSPITPPTGRQFSSLQLSRAAVSVRTAPDKSRPSPLHPPRSPPGGLGAAPQFPSYSRSPARQFPISRISPTVSTSPQPDQTAPPGSPYNAAPSKWPLFSDLPLSQAPAPAAICYLAGPSPRRAA